MTSGSRRVVGPGVFLGLWITTLGVIFLLDQLGIVPAHVSFHFVWPAILIFLGLGIILSPRHGPDRIWGAFLFALGAVFLANELGYVQIRLGALWPLGLIGLGIWMLLNSSGRLGHPGRWSRWQDRMEEPTRDPPQHPLNDVPPPMPPGAPPEPPPAATVFGVHTSGRNGDDATFDQAVILSGFKRRVTSQRFRFGKVTAILGGFQLDLTRADMDGGGAVLHIDTVFGGGEVRVPDTWRIVIEATAVAGAFIDETYPQPAATAAPAKQLIVRGAAIFGGVNIKN
jgi:Domain of unknown function (DUF5668)/Cell wall-active antibiotics response 4TMS YvqF